MTIGADIRETFFQECEDLLESLFDGLEALNEQDSPTDSETVNGIFRAVHSIKGGGAAFQLTDLVGFAHSFENALDLLRSGQTDLTTSLAELLQKCADHLADLVRASRLGEGAPTGRTETLEQQLSALTPNNTPPVSAGSTGDSLSFVPLPLCFDLPEDSGQGQWSITFSAQPGLLESGNDPVHLLRELGTLGVMQCEALLTRLPTLEKLDPEELYLDWQIHLTTAASQPEIEQVFEFVNGLCRLDISALAEPDMEEEPPIGPPMAPEPVTRTPAATRATLRVELSQIDQLINLVGELVINQSVLERRMLDQGISPLGDLAGSLSDLKNLAREIQEGVMSIRAQQVKPLFQRMARIARDAAELAGKQIRFITEGEATEVDKIVIEQLVDPLTHMIRNAVDHGLEPPENRLAAGKPDQGLVRLSTTQRAGRIVIEVADDGGGINRTKVLDKARARGLVAADAVLSDTAIDNLLFLPGLSTAEAVTSLSGRGVGLDVVSSAIRKLGGRIAIQSTPGAGTTMSISLPLTLAVLKGMVVKVADQTMVMPVAAIRQTLKPALGDLQSVEHEGHVLRLRDQFLPVLDLGEVFGFRHTPADLAKMIYLIVETESGALCAFAVDAINDQQQVVIKGLETTYGHVPCVAAATILGNGSISLIIDPEEAAQSLRPKRQAS